MLTDIMRFIEAVTFFSLARYCLCVRHTDAACLVNLLDTGGGRGYTDVTDTHMSGGWVGGHIPAMRDADAKPVCATATKGGVGRGRDRKGRYW